MPDSLSPSQKTKGSTSDLSRLRLARETHESFTFLFFVTNTVNGLRVKSKKLSPKLNHEGALPPCALHPARCLLTEL